MHKIRFLENSNSSRAAAREAKWYQSAADTHGNWKWQGSNDNSSYNDIGSSFTLGSASVGQILTTLTGNQTAYRYYRLTKVSASTNEGP